VDIQYDENELNLTTNDAKKGLPEAGKNLHQSNFLKITLEFFARKLYVELSLN
jgi:hypothetical protein